jgi:hypothetical protein
MLDNLGASKAATKTNTRPWQQGNDTRGYDDRGDNGLHSSHADGEDNDAATGNNWDNTTAADDDGGDADTSTLSVETPQAQQ